MKRFDIVVDRSRHDVRKDMRKEHFHERYEIYYLISGERFYFIDHQVYHVLPGDLVFIDRFALHKTRDTGSEHHDRFLIEFTAQYLQDSVLQVEHLLARLFIKGGRLMHVKLHEREWIEGKLAAIVKEADQQATDYELNIRLLIIDLLISSIRMLEQNEQSEYVKKQFHPKLSGILRHINEHYADPACSLDQLCQLFKLSKYHFCRMFKQYSGYTFTQYVNLLKVREAQRLLRTTKYKVTEIAGLAGFENVPHFNRVFKQISHCSPSQYRNKQGANE